MLDSIRTMSKEVADLKIHLSSLDDSVVLVKELLAAEIEEKKSGDCRSG
ncbi:hypothetical protein [Algoriphagus boritolerans]